MQRGEKRREEREIVKKKGNKIEKKMEKGIKKGEEKESRRGNLSQKFDSIFGGRSPNIFQLFIHMVQKASTESPHRSNQSICSLMLLSHNHILPHKRSFSYNNHKSAYPDSDCK